MCWCSGVCNVRGCREWLESTDYPAVVSSAVQDLNEQLLDEWASEVDGRGVDNEVGRCGFGIDRTTGEFDETTFGSQNVSEAGAARRDP